MHWLYLIVAGLFETAWAVGMGYSQGFTKPLPSVLTVIGMVISFYFLAQALKVLPLGTGYAIWTGIGTVGTVVLGILLFHEAISFSRFFFIGCIIFGIIGLKLTSV